MYLQGGEIVNSYNYSKMQLLKTAEKGNTLKKKKKDLCRDAGRRIPTCLHDLDLFRGKKRCN